MPVMWCRGTHFHCLCVTDFNPQISHGNKEVLGKLYVKTQLVWMGCQRGQHSSCECPSALGRAKAEVSPYKHCAHILGTIPAPCSLVTGCALHAPAGTAGPSGHLLSTRASRDHLGPKLNQQQQLCLHPRFLAALV